MWHPKTLYIQNFMSFEEATFTFDENKPYLIWGVNRTDSGQQSNGSGKSAIQEALYRGLTGTSIRKGVRNEDLINDFSDECVIEQIWFNTFTRHELKIVRNLSRKRSESLEIFIDGVSQKNKFATVNDGNRFILEECFMLSREDIDSSFIINREKYTSFFFTSDTQKKEFIGRFSNADIISGVEQYVEQDLRILNEVSGELKSKVISIESAIQVHDQFIDENLRSDYRKAIVEQHHQEIKKQIEGVESVIEDDFTEIENQLRSIGESQQEIEIWGKRIEEIDEQLLQFDDSELIVELETIRETLKESSEVSLYCEQEQQNIVKDHKLCIVKLNDIQNKLAGVITCPKCGHEFSLKFSESVIELRKALVELQDKQQSLKSDIEQKNSELHELSSIVQEFKQAEKEVQRKIDDVFLAKQRLENERKSVKLKIDLLNKQIASCDQSIEYFHQSIDKNKKLIKGFEDALAVKIDFDERVKEAQSKKAKLQEELIVINNELKENDDLKFATEQWIFNFKSFYSYLTNKSLALIEQQTNRFLELMKVDLRLRIEGYKVLSSGKIKENITPIIIRNGMVEGNGVYGKLSGGERVRIDLANLLARQQIVNDSNPVGGMNLLFIDEITEGLDGVGLDVLMNSLSELSKNVYIITHITPNENHNAILIEKINGTSKIM